MSDENKAIARILIERALSNNEVGAVIESLSVVCRPHDPALSGLAPGAGSFGRRNNIFPKAFPDLIVGINSASLHRNKRGTYLTDFTCRGWRRQFPYFAFITEKFLKAGPAGTSSR